MTWRWMGSVPGPCRPSGLRWTWSGYMIRVTEDRYLDEVVCSEDLKNKEALETGCMWEGKGLGQTQVRAWKGSPRLTVSMSNSRGMPVQGSEHSVCSSRNEASHQWVDICPWPPSIIPVPFAVLTVLSDLLKTSWSWGRGQAESLVWKLWKGFKSFGSAGLATQQPESFDFLLGNFSSTRGYIRKRPTLQIRE